MPEREFVAFRPEVVTAAVVQPEFATIAGRGHRRRRRRVGALTATALAVILAVAAVPVAGRWFAGRPSGGTVAAPAASTGASPRTDFDRRAVAVVDAWQRGGLAYSSRLGFVPQYRLTELTVASKIKSGTFDVEDTFPDRATHGAFEAGRYRLSGALPATTPPPGTVTLPDGKTLTMPLASAQAAYRAIDRSDPSPNCSGEDCTVLTVTGATLGTVPIRANGSEARVPAWVFTVAELKAPIARVAVASSASSGEVLRLPSELLPEARDGFTDADDATAVGSTTRITLSYLGGTCDISSEGHAYETPEALVVGVSGTATPGVCTTAGVRRTVEVALARPLGDRVVLSVNTGERVPPVRAAR